MTRKRYEEIVAKLRQVDVLVSQGQNRVDAIRQIGVSEVTYDRWRQELSRLAVAAQAYTSRTLVLLAMDWSAGKQLADFLGFAILRRPGFSPGQKEGYFLNKIGFDPPQPDSPPLPSNVAPLQRFLWWDNGINESDRGKTFKYTITPVRGTGPDDLVLEHETETTISVTLPQVEEDGIATWFNRAVVSSQAFSREFPDPQSKIPEVMDWLANGLEEAFAQILSGAKSISGAIYHLTDKRWVVPALQDFPGELSVVYDDRNNDRTDRSAIALLESARFEGKPRTKTNIMHNKFLVDVSGGRVLMGSADFTPEGLTSQANLLHIFNSPQLASLYAERQQLIADDPTIGETAKSAGWSKPVKIGKTTVRVFFSPEPKNKRVSIDTVISSVKGAYSSVIFCMSDPTDPKLITSLLATSDRKKLLYGLLTSITDPTAKKNNRSDSGEAPHNPSPATQIKVTLFNRSRKDKKVLAYSFFHPGATPADFLPELSAVDLSSESTLPPPKSGQKKRAPPAVHIHHKFIVIDADTDNPTIYTGSTNLSNNSTYKNDENLLEIKGNPGLARTYFAEFMRLYQHYRAKTLWYLARGKRGRERTFTLKRSRDAWVNGAYRPGTAAFIARTRLAGGALAVPPTVIVPTELIQQCSGGECALIAGSGLSAGAGLPTWRQVVDNMLQWATEQKVISADYAAAQREALADDPNIVADNLASAFQSNRDALIEFWGHQFPPDTLPSPTHDLLVKIPFAVAATTNLDSLLERAYKSTGMEQVYTPEDSEALLGMLSARTPFLLKLYGTLERPQTVIFSPAEYKAMVSRHIPFTRFMEGLYFSRTLLFVGSSLEGISDFLNSFPFRAENPRRHYALVGGELGTGWKAKTEALSRRYNIEVIPFDASEGHEVVNTFIEDLATEVGTLKKEALHSPPTTESRLTRVELRNIGPFENLELRFAEPWLVLLGDNGVGKSSILKAIAVAIVGADASAVAGRLIRAGQTLSEVRLFTDKNPSGYLTEIYTTTGSQAQVASKPARPLETEGWIVFGFPPLRTGTWTRSGEHPPRKPRPTPDDVLPLATGEVDSRMDKLKQWLIGLDLQIKEDRANRIFNGRSERIRKKFFEIVGELAEGASVEFDEITAENEVRVRTKDGPVPIEALSQGMTSLYSWIGILVQRLFEIHENSDDPTKHHAIVLMDELDAHMHPKWQRSMVVNLKRIFPRLQMIVSTHSPLIVAGMKPVEVARFARNKAGAVVQVPLEQDMLLGRADQVLTTSAFGLTTTLDLQSQKYLADYRDLLAKPQHTDDDKKKLSELENLVESNVPPVDEGLLHRRTQNLLDLILTPEVIDKLEPETRRALAAKVKPVSDILAGEIDAHKESA